MHMTSLVSRAFRCHPETSLPTLQVRYCHRAHLWTIQGWQHQGETPNLFNRQHGLEWSGMRGTAASRGQLPVPPAQAWDGFSVSGLSSRREPKLLAASIWRYDSIRGRPLTDWGRYHWENVTCEEQLCWGSHQGATPSDCEHAWLCQASMELVDNGGYASKYIFPVKTILLNLDSLILAILISVSSSWLQCSSPKALFPQKCWLMLSHQQADEQKRKHSREKLSKSHHPDMTAEAKEPLSHTPPPTGRKTPS